jgi:putative MATE family efflux protein
LTDASYLEKEKVSKLLFKFAIPGMVGLFVLSMYNVCDRIFVGQGVGAIGLSAVTMVYPIAIARFAMCLIIAAGAGTLISISLGEKKQENAEKVIGTALFFGLLMAFVQTYFGVFHAKPILEFFGAKGNLLPHSVAYMETLFVGAVFMFGSFFFNFTIRADGSPKISMQMLIISALLNIVLDYIFVFPLNMGVKGAAIATVIAQFFSFSWGVLYYFMGKSVVKIKKEYFKLDFSVLSKVFTVGFPPFLRDAIWCLQNWYMNYQLIKYGSEMAVAAMGIIYATQMFVFMPIAGLVEGMQPIVGYNFGAKKIARVKEALIFTLKITTIVAVLDFTIIQLFPDFIISFFNKGSDELLQISRSALRIYFAGLFMAGIITTLSSYLYCVKKVRSAISIVLLKKGVLFFALLYVLPPIFKVDGVWLSMSGTEYGFFLISGVWFVHEIRELNKKINQSV